MFARRCCRVSLLILYTALVDNMFALAVPPMGENSTTNGAEGEATSSPTALPETTHSESNFSASDFNNDTTETPDQGNTTGPTTGPTHVTTVGSDCSQVIHDNQTVACAVDKATTRLLTTTRPSDSAGEDAGGTVDQTNATMSRPAGSISQEQFHRWHGVIWRYCIPSIGLTGLALDGIGLSVLSLIPMSKSFRCFLYGLMIGDEIYLLSVLVWSVPKIVKPYDALLANFLESNIRTPIEGLGTTMYAICTYLITLMSIERFMQVLLPIQMKLFPTRKYVTPIICTVYFVNIALMMPAYFISYGEEYLDQNENRTMYRLVRAEWFAKAVDFRLIYPTVLTAIVKFVPLTITVVCNVGICVCLSRRQRARSALFDRHGATGAGKEQRRVTITLVALAAFLSMSLVTSSTAFLLSKFNSDFMAGGREARLTAIIYDVGELLTVICASNDFIIYIVASQQARGVLRNVFKNTLPLQTPARLSTLSSVDHSHAGGTGIALHVSTDSSAHSRSADDGIGRAIEHL